MSNEQLHPDRGLGFGVVAGLADDLLRALAVEVRDLGYGAFWINDSGRPDADGLAGLRVVAGAAPNLDLGVGVVPLDRRPPAQIAREIADLGLPLERLRLGVGSGAEHVSPLGVVRDGVAALREALPGARLFVSALGLRMSQLAGEVADGVLFNWATPARLREVSKLADEAARTAGRQPVERWSYVRSAVGPDARQRLGDEAGRYANAPAYGRAFDAMGVALDQIGVTGDDLRLGLEAYRDVLDGVVVRALPATWTLADALAIARAAAPRQAG